MAILFELGIGQRRNTLSYDQWVVPASGATELLITANIAPADFVNPAKGLYLGIHVWDPATSTWQYFTHKDWAGDPNGNPNDPDQMPSLSVNFAGKEGRTARGEMRILPAGERMGVGIRIESI